MLQIRFPVRRNHENKVCLSGQSNLQILPCLPLHRSTTASSGGCWEDRNGETSINMICKIHLRKLMCISQHVRLGESQRIPLLQNYGSNGDRGSQLLFKESSQFYTLSTLVLSLGTVILPAECVE